MIDSISQNGHDQVDLHRRRRVRPNHSASVDRLPPHSPEAEQGVLGCIMLSPRECGNEVVALLGSSVAEVMYDLRNQTILDTVIEMMATGEAIDLITIQARLKKKQLLDQVGGIIYLCQLADGVPSSANLKYYVDIIREKYILRKTIHLCTDCVGMVYEHEGDVETLMDTVEKDILSIRKFSHQEEVVGIKEDVRRAIEVIEEYQRRQGGIIGLTTGFIDYDKMTGGMSPGDMIVIAARPSMGKTSLAMNIADHIAVNQKLPVGVFSLEMKRTALVTRMICSRARVNLRNLTEGFVSERDFPKMTGSAGKIANSPIHIEDSGGLTIMQLRAKARRMHQQFGIKFMVIDYLQKLMAFIGKKRIENRQQEVAEISNGIKALAMELGIPILTLCQLDRRVEREKGRKPMMSDLRESGAIEADADTIGLLYKPAKDENSEQEEVDCTQMNLIVAKQRNGPTGEVHLTFLKAYTRFESAAKVCDADVPNQETLL